MNVFLLTEKHLHQFFSRETNAGISLYERGRVTRMAIDAANVGGVVIDDNGEEILTRFNFDLSEIGAAVRTTQQARAVAAALSSIWRMAAPALRYMRNDDCVPVCPPVP